MVLIVATFLGEGSNIPRKMSSAFRILQKVLGDPGGPLLVTAEETETPYHRQTELGRAGHIEAPQHVGVATQTTHHSNQP